MEPALSVAVGTCKTIEQPPTEGSDMESLHASAVKQRARRWRPGSGRARGPLAQVVRAHG